MGSTRDEEEKKRLDQAFLQAKARRQKEWVQQQQNDEEQDALALQNQQMMHTVSPADGAGLTPEKIKAFLADPINKAIKDICKYDEKTGILTFPGGKEGAKALAGFLEEFPDAKFKTMGLTDMAAAKTNLRELKEARIDAKKNMGSMEIAGKTYSGTALRVLIDKLSPPRPTATTTG